MKDTLAERLASFRLLVADLDGTLIDTEPLHLESYELLVSLLRDDATVIEASEIVGRREPEIWAGLTRRFELAAHPEQLQELRRHVFLGLCAERAELTRERSVWSYIDSFRGPKVLLTSQSPRLANTLMRVVGITDTFDELISTQQPGVPTSKVAVIDELMRRYDVHGPETVWFEDAAPDIAAVKRLGVSVCVVRRSYNRSTQRLADWVI
jgi:HAD superfamily hydrolase (TIGR01509 family)